MLTSLSPLAWGTAAMFFAMTTVGLVFIPQMFLNRLEESLLLLEERSQHLEEFNVSLRKEIEARKKAEKAVQEAQTIINRSPAVALLWKNADGWPVEFTSDNVTGLFGFKAEEFTSGKITYRQVVYPDDLERVEEEIAIYSGEEGREEFNHDPYRIVTKDGEVKWLEDMTFIRRNEEGEITHYEGIVLDISERVKAEAEKQSLQAKLQRSQKMESLGLLAGGVAHDLNNVLSGIISYPELLLFDLPEDSKLRKPIETMQDSGLRAAAIVQDLLTVARGVATTKEPLNLNSLVTHYLHSPEFNKLKHFHPTVRIETNLDSDLFNIYGSHVHIRKAVMNLVSNASEAIEGSGKVTISTVNRYVDKPLKGYDNVTIGEYAVLSVSDDGSGISSADLERIFEPFYTKKVMGRSGTGLGLTVVWNVVQDHQGYIDVKSDESGTTFKLYFPIAREKIKDEALSIAIKDYRGNGETVLVVDDIESQRDISCRILDTLGYRSKAVSSGEEAIEYVKEKGVDLLLLDMIMEPGINGRETYERIVEIQPKQKAIIVSGFAETDEVKAIQEMGAGQYIKKPLTLQKIGLAIKEELEK
jgi:two-component system cell cycle sensor histidine kinase/response regulator CckA